MKKNNNSCENISYNSAIDKKKLKDIIKCISEYVSYNHYTCTDVPILMERDIQDGLFIEDKKSLKCL